MITTFPVNLLLNGKKCLVVGGGKIALRKIRKLLDFDAEVIVVASEPSPGIKELARNNLISLNERPFKDSDINDISLVYAATDDHALNNKIIMLAEKTKILVCSIDKGWKKGSFITPASIRSKEITISVSSHGVACRKTKLIKENLARHINSIENTKLIVIGTDHRFLPLEKREPLHLSGQEQIDRTGEMIMNIWGLQGFILLNTCNRIELITAIENSPPLIDLLKMILKFDSLKKEQYYIKTDYEAFKHLCFCVSGLYSQTPGENHITAQFKDACIYAQNKNWAGPIFDMLHNDVLHVTKHIRNRTSDFFKRIEIEDITLKFLETKIPDFRNRNISVIGTGALGTRIKEILIERKSKINWVYHSKSPCPETGISIFSLNDLECVLRETDVLITALSSDKPVIFGTHDKFFRPGTEVIDLGMPRNLSGDLAKLRNDVNFTNIENLKHWHRRNNCDMTRVFDETEKIIDEHRNLHEKFDRSFTDGNKAE